MENVENKVCQFVGSPISTLKLDQVENFKYEVEAKSHGTIKAIWNIILIEVWNIHSLNKSKYDNTYLIYLIYLIHFL